eukprot:gene10900-43954_t
MAARPITVTTMVTAATGVARADRAALPTAPATGYSKGGRWTPPRRRKGAGGALPRGRRHPPNRGMGKTLVAELPPMTGEGWGHADMTEFEETVKPWGEQRA